MNIQNPILPGFYPDPSIVRRGDDYYIANSTFEYFPGIPIHHSRDLVNWQLIGHALTRPSQINLAGVEDSAGVWAPSMSYSDGQFWLIYTNVRHRVGAFKDVQIFLTTADDPAGPWSDPILLGGGGFDPSLFHDQDGRKWLVNMRWDHRKDRPRFGGIVIQEYNHSSRKLIGPIHHVLEKSVLIEGPNLYQRDGWYYLMLAEGGTGWNHGISMARSRSLLGPYEVDPVPVMTSRKSSGLELQKAGHGELVETPSGEWYLAHLCSRPVYPSRRCILGRETAIQKVHWTKDGWLRLDGGGYEVSTQVPAPIGIKPHPCSTPPARDDFDGTNLSAHWQALRTPFDDSWLSLAARPGWLRLYGRQSLHSRFDQSLVLRRLTSLRCTIETRLEFTPSAFNQAAGLICWYDTKTHYYLRVTHDSQQGKVLGVVLSDDGAYDELLQTNISIDNWPAIYLRATFDSDELRFSASPDGASWRPVGGHLDATRLSDDYGSGLHFTGAMVGVGCQDLEGTLIPAEFDYFSESGSNGN